MIFSLFANSSARSNGILRVISLRQGGRKSRYLPNTLQVHGANFDNVTRLLALENSITSSSCHPSDIEQLRTVDHVVV